MQRDINTIIEKAKEESLLIMAKAGFPLNKAVSIGFDPRLPFMGYTTERNGRPLIVVSRMSLESGLLNGLIIHEMGHIYQTEQLHPSHNHQNLASLINRFLRKHKLTFKYQREAMQEIVNTIQDLYADDVSFIVYRKNPGNTFREDQFADFFMGWIHAPIFPVDTVQKRWKNATSVVNAAFAKSNLERHHIKDKDNLVQNAINVFLSKVQPSHATKFSYFNNFMVHLPQNPTDEKFSTILEDYFERYRELI